MLKVVKVKISVKGGFVSLNSKKRGKPDKMSPNFQKGRSRGRSVNGQHVFTCSKAVRSVRYPKCRFA